MKKYMNIIIGVLGSVVMMFGILFFLSFMEEDESTKLNEQVAQTDEKEVEKSLSNSNSSEVSSTDKQIDNSDAEQRAKEEQAAKAKAEQVAKAKEEQAAKAKAEQVAKAKEEQAAKAKAEQVAKAKEEQAKVDNSKPTETNTPNKTPSEKSKQIVADEIPDPYEDYEGYLEAVGVDMTEPEPISAIEGVNAERGQTLFTD